MKNKGSTKSCDYRNHETTDFRRKESGVPVARYTLMYRNSPDLILNCWGSLALQFGVFRKADNSTLYINLLLR